MGSEVVLKGEGLALGYKKQGKESVIAKEISFSLEKGKLTCLLGPNGVGKSTLIKTIMGQIPILKGKITLMGTDILDFNPKLLAKKIAVVLTDKVALGNLTVYQLVSLGRIPHTSWLGNLSSQDHEVVERSLVATNTSYLKDKVLSELSDGQLQKVMIARALVQDGEVLILDEPTAHLDLINRFEIMHLLRSIAQEEGKAVLVVTHDLDIAIDTADEFWLMQCGLPLVCAVPEDLIVSGEINLLLPSASLQFNPLTGKIEDSMPYTYPPIEGKEILSNWLKLIIRKNSLVFAEDFQGISISDYPFLIKVKWEKKEQIYNCFKSFVEDFS